MLDALSQLLLGVRWVVLGQGEVRLAPPAGALLAAAVALGSLALAALLYRAAPRRVNGRDRIVLTALRGAVLALLLLCLFRPTLVLRAAVPHQNVLAVLLDDSRSMRIADQGGRPRGDWVTEQFGAAERGLRAALGERFTVRPLRFAGTVGAATGEPPLRFDGGATRLAAALDTARQQLSGAPLAGVVVVSDGADTTGQALEPTILAMKAAGVPVFTVGVGSERPDKDVQVGRLSAPRRVLAGTTMMLEGIVTAHGYAGQSVQVDVLDGSQIVGTQPVTLPPDGQPATVRVRVTATEPGARPLTVRVPAQPGELLTENNQREVVVEVRDRREKILYFEGEPRFEVKFLRRAVAEDKQLQLVVLQRTADAKFLRLDVDGPDELLGGFPKSRDELFGYRGIVLGSVEAGAFTGDQLQMIADFVDRRGGGLLMLGGPRAFSEGGYAGTSVGGVLPFVVDKGEAQPASAPPARLAIRPTRAGAGHAIAQIAASEKESAARWDSLPPLTSVNATSAVTPGATVLLAAQDASRRDRPVLAFQRYGRGKAVGFTAQDTWLWQMHATIPVEDQTHETFTRQLLRWLVDGVPDRVELTTSSERVEPGEPLTLTAEIADPSFLPLNDAVVTATVIAPDGKESQVPLTWTGERDGVYTATLTPPAAGWYETTVEARRGDQTIASSPAHVRAGGGDAEYLDSTLQSAALRRLAEDTGGRYYTPADAARLTEDVKYTGRGITAVEERELWNAPAMLLLIVGLLCGEWGYRRAVGLA